MIFNYFVFYLAQKFPVDSDTEGVVSSTLQQFANYISEVREGIGVIYLFIYCELL